MHQIVEGRIVTVGPDIARIYEGTAMLTTNSELAGIYLYLGTNGTLQSGWYAGYGKLAQGKF